MFSWCFLSVSRYFSIIRNLCWEPHFWTENRIFKNFSKSLKTCFVGVFWVFQCIFSCDQAALWMVQSVRPSVCLSVRPSVRLSVCHTFLTMFPSSYHHEIFRSYYQWQKWRPCKRSRSEVKGQGHRGHNPTLPFPDCNSSLNSRMMMKWYI